MTVPVFEEYEPAVDCPCAGCAEERREQAKGLSVRAGGHPAARRARRALVLATAAGAVLGVTGTGPARAEPPPPGAAEAGVTADPEPPTPQGISGPVYERPAGPEAGIPQDPLHPSTRAEIIDRAREWVGAKVPYSTTALWSDGYRQDCSGFVSMAWNLEGNEWTGSLAQFGTKIARADLRPGDILLFHNPDDPNDGSHVTIFGGWADVTHTFYLAYEQSPPHARAAITPMAYWTNSSRYVPYRYKGLVAGSAAGGTTAPGAEEVDGAATAGARPPGTGAAAAGSHGPPGHREDARPPARYPGARAFGRGAQNPYVTRLGEMLVERGGGRFYPRGPAARWSSADRRATRAFQRAQGWRGAQADGLPGAETWRYLVKGLGKDIPRAAAAGRGRGRTPVFPGRRYFRDGRSGPHIEKLGKQLVKKGFGKHYLSPPGPRWDETDRRSVKAFQRAQGWRGRAADGYPGAETWRRLFA